MKHLGQLTETQRLLFTQNLRSLDCISPTKASLYQHVKRTVLVSAFVWYRALEKQLYVPNNPEEYCWE